MILLLANMIQLITCESILFEFDTPQCLELFSLFNSRVKPKAISLRCHTESRPEETSERSY